MINLKLNHNKGFKWYSSNGISIKGFAFVKERLLSEKELFQHFYKIDSEIEFHNALLELNGQFAVIILRKNKIMASVDRLRVFPLLYTLSKDTISITDDYRTLSSPPHSINYEAKISMLAFGYVLGKETLLENVFQLQAGEYLIFENNSIKVNQWYRPIPIKENSLTKVEWKLKIKQKLFGIGKRLSQYIQGRPVVLPLSGGFDSRLIALLLKINNHTNTLCFTYGKEFNHEAKRSEEIAKRLNFSWLFIDYFTYIRQDYLQTTQFNNYYKFIGNTMTFPYLQEYFAALFLKETYKLESSSLFIPGHSGDMLGGSHLFPDMEKFKSKNDLIKKIIRKNPSFTTLSNNDWEIVINKLRLNITPEYYNYTHLSHDYWNIKERQSKQIINSAKVWDFFGYQYILPLWDSELTELFLELPFEYRVFKNLYDEVLIELFQEHHILLKEELHSSSINLKRYSYLKMKIKEYLPLVTKFKKTNQRDIFYMKEFLQPMNNKLPFEEKKRFNGILSAWYIDSLTKEFS